MDSQSGAFADGLTLVRVAMTPIIMLVIIRGGWPSIDMALLASMLFIVAAMTDLLDNVVGGHETSQSRRLGWFDDVADTALITGTLAAILWRLYSAQSVTWVFAAPALAIIIRECLVGLIKGRAFRKNGWPETRFGSIKTFFTMLAVSMLIASPWLSNWIGRLQGNIDPVTNIYTAPWVGTLSVGLLWLAALFSILTGLMLLTGKTMAANDA